MILVDSKSRSVASKVGLMTILPWMINPLVYIFAQFIGSGGNQTILFSIYMISTMCPISTALNESMATPYGARKIRISLQEYFVIIGCLVLISLCGIYLYLWTAGIEKVVVSYSYILVSILITSGVISSFLSAKYLSFGLVENVVSKRDAAIITLLPIIFTQLITGLYLITSSSTNFSLVAGSLMTSLPSFVQFIYIRLKVAKGNVTDQSILKRNRARNNLVRSGLYYIMAISVFAGLVVSALKLEIASNYSESRNLIFLGLGAISTLSTATLRIKYFVACVSTKKNKQDPNQSNFLLRVATFLIIFGFLLFVTKLSSLVLSSMLLAFISVLIPLAQAKIRENII